MKSVIPAQAGIQVLRERLQLSLDSRFRGNDDKDKVIPESSVSGFYGLKDRGFFNDSWHGRQAVSMVNWSWILRCQILLLLLAPQLFAASATMRVGYPQPSGAMLPLWLVSEAKLDQKYGVPVQNIFISGAGRMTQAMVAGDIDLASIGGAVVNTVLGGGDLVSIAVGVPTYGFSFTPAPMSRISPACKARWSAS